MTINGYLADIVDIIEKIPDEMIALIIDVLQFARQRGSRIYIMGNGGSATTASHIAGDLKKTCGLRAMALTDSNYLITSLANDCGYDKIFSHQLARFLDEDDIVVGLSGSGKSLNIVEGFATARGHGAKSIALTGFDGGFLTDIADICLIVPSEVMEQIEDIHLMIGHILITELKNRRS